MTETNVPHFSPQPKQGEHEDPKYLAFIRSLPCLICNRKAVAAHVRNLKWGAGTGQKPWDYCTVPLCDDPFGISHHNHLDKIGMADFEYFHKINLRDEIIKHMAIYIESKRRGKP